MKLFIMTLFFASAVHGFVTVGTDESCDFDPTNFQFAVQTNDEVRVTNQAILAPIEIINRSVIIKGGYDNCNDAEIDAQRFLKTEIEGQNLSTVLKITTTAAGGHLPRSITLEHLKLADGLTSGSNLSGGLDIGGNVDVTLIEVEIRDNQANTHGGGVYIFGSQGAKVTMEDVDIKFNEAPVGAGMVISSGAEVIMNGSFIDNNMASNNSGGVLVTSGSKLSLYDSLVRSNRGVDTGGGISCSNSEIYLDSESRVTHNRASFGGGLYASNNCHGLIESGNDSIPADTLEGIVVNEADVFGGGIYALDSTLTLKGSATHYMNMYFNFTDETNPTSQGGAIYARGNSHITLINTRVEKNAAKFGSAITATDGARVRVMRSSGDCFNDEECSLISDNTALFGTIHTDNCGVIEVFQTTIRENIAADGAIAYLNGNESDECKTVFEGNLIYRNQDEIDETTSLFLLDRQASLSLGFNTITDNLTDHIVKMNNTNSSAQSLSINSSIIWNAPANTVIANSNSHTYSGNCFLAHDSQNLPAGFGGLILNIDPVFQNPVANDYQLSFNSPPIDYCDTSLFQPQFHDIINTPRGLQYAPPVLGLYDMGAFEYDDGTHIGDVIFYDRFD
jgi:hypothetical protein